MNFFRLIVFSAIWLSCGVVNGSQLDGIVSPLRFRGHWMQASAIPVQQQGDFEPYADNGGSAIGIAGHDFALVAADSRLSDSYMIRSRNVSRIAQIEESMVLVGAGCWSDFTQLSEVLQARARVHRWHSCRGLGIGGAATTLSSELYSRRMFPYFSFCILAGIDEKGQGAVYNYDAVGSRERVRASAIGKGDKMMQPLLDATTALERDDSLWKLSEDCSEFLSTENLVSTLTKEQAIAVALKAFRAAAEREITVGDGVHVWILCRRGADIVTEKSYYPLSNH